ncbi:hypothetical protein P692DRAFT_20829182 [Suillus brevipes Sb2]|nr:hypothetical protein P692DRAFT_20829182 [Suillus brevipes Sb2]
MSFLGSESLQVNVFCAITVLLLGVQTVVKRRKNEKTSTATTKTIAGPSKASQLSLPQRPLRRLHAECSTLATTPPICGLNSCHLFVYVDNQFVSTSSSFVKTTLVAPPSLWKSNFVTILSGHEYM